MNPINVHLKYLISRHDCVIVPGFGAFISETVPAFIDEDSLTVYPSFRRLSFNSELTMDDGLLSHSIARREKIGHQDARRIIDHTVISFNERLHEGRKLNLDGIGVFTLSEEDTKIFEPISINPDRGCTLPQKTVNVAENTTAKSNNVQEFQINDRDSEPESEAGELPKAGRTRFNTRKNYYLPINKLFARIACMLIIVAGVSLVFIHPSDTLENKTQQASIVPVETLLNMRNKPDSTSVRNERVPIQNNGVSKTEQKRFHLIVGTFTSRDEAERFIASTEDDTTALTPVEGRAGMWRVALKSSDERESLQKTLNEVKDRFEGVWIWEKR